MGYASFNPNPAQNGFASEDPGHKMVWRRRTQDTTWFGVGGPRTQNGFASEDPGHKMDPGSPNFNNHRVLLEFANDAKTKDFAFLVLSFCVVGGPVGGSKRSFFHFAFCVTQLRCGPGSMDTRGH